MMFIFFASFFIVKSFLFLIIFYFIHVVNIHCIVFIG